MKDKQKANGAYPLFARITVDGVASRFNTKLDVLPFIIILIHPLNKIIHQMMKICRPVFSFFHGYI